MVENPLCACGCGKSVKNPQDKYLHGHHLRDPAIHYTGKGKVWSESGRRRKKREEVMLKERALGEATPVPSGNSSFDAGLKVKGDWPHPLTEEERKRGQRAGGLAAKGTARAIKTGRYSPKFLKEHNIPLCSELCIYKPCSAYRPGYPCRVKIESVKSLSKLLKGDAEALEEAYKQMIETMQGYRTGMDSETRKRDFMIYAREYHKMVQEFLKARFGEKRQVEIKGQLATLNIADFWEKIKEEEKRKQEAC